jgi:hypothetical protein
MRSLMRTVDAGSRPRLLRDLRGCCIVDPESVELVAAGDVLSATLPRLDGCVAVGVGAPCTGLVRSGGTSNRVFSSLNINVSNAKKIGA